MFDYWKVYSRVSAFPKTAAVSMWDSVNELYFKKNNFYMKKCMMIIGSVSESQKRFILYWTQDFHNAESL